MEQERIHTIMTHCNYELEKISFAWAKRLGGQLMTSAKASKKALTTGRIGAMESGSAFTKSKQLTQPQQVQGLEGLDKIDDAMLVQTQSKGVGGTKTVGEVKAAVEKAKTTGALETEKGLRGVTAEYGLGDDAVSGLVGRQKVPLQTPAGQPLNMADEVTTAVTQRYQNLTNQRNAVTSKLQTADDATRVGLREELAKIDDQLGQLRTKLNVDKTSLLDDTGKLDTGKLRESVSNSVSKSVGEAQTAAREEAVSAALSEMGLSETMAVGKNIKEVVVLNPMAEKVLDKGEMLTYAGVNALGFAGRNAETIAKAGVYGGGALGAYGVYKLLD